MCALNTTNPPFVALPLLPIALMLLSAVQFPHPSSPHTGADEYWCTLLMTGSWACADHLASTCVLMGQLDEASLV